jgi:uncharacterized phage-associated protein
MNTIHFQFDESKLVQALAFFSLNGVRDLTKLKAAKLLFFADKLHLNRYGRPITGDSYACMEHGPVPSISLNEMNYALETDQEIQFEEEPALLRVLGTTKQQYPVFYLKDPKLFDPDVFSESDLEVLGEVVQVYGGKSAWQLRQESHSEEAWLMANQFRSPGSSTPIAFERLFDENNQEMLEAVLQEQKEEEALESALLKALFTAA